MKCVETRRDMFAFLDGEVSVERNLEVLQHVNGCTACARRFEAEKRFEEGFDRVLAAEPVPPGLRARLGAALDAEAGGPATRPVLRPSAWRRFRFFALAATLLLAAGLVADRFCLGPFQCPVIRAATEAAGDAESGRGRVTAGGWDWQSEAKQCPDGAYCIVQVDLGEHDPKPGNLVEDAQGRSWYEAEVGDRRIVGWKDGGIFRALVTRAAGVDLERLAKAARGK